MSLFAVFALIIFLFLARNSFAAICVADADCASGEECISGNCVKPAPPQQSQQSEQDMRAVQEQQSTQQKEQQQAAVTISAEDLQRAAAATLNPAGFKEPTAVIARGINILLAFIGSIALVLYIWAGILWMSSAGNTERVSRARSIMLWTTLGVAVMLGSYVIVTFVFDIFK